MFLLGRHESKVLQSNVVTAVNREHTPFSGACSGATLFQTSPQGISGKALWQRQDTSSFEGQASLEWGREGCAPGEGTEWAKMERNESLPCSGKLQQIQCDHRVLHMQDSVKR